MIVTAPVETAVTNPVSLTVATPVFDEVQVTFSSVFEGFTVAVNCTVFEYVPFPI